MGETRNRNIIWCGNPLNSTHFDGNEGNWSGDEDWIELAQYRVQCKAL